MKFQLEGLTVYFPYEYIYPEQYKYMLELKHALDAKGHCLLEMPTGTGKTITLLSLITSYQLAHPEMGKLVYCTRTVPEMEKVLAELRDLFEYRKRYLPDGRAPKLLALGLSSRKNLCVNPDVANAASGESVDQACAERTSPWVRARAGIDVAGQREARRARAALAATTPAGDGGDGAGAGDGGPDDASVGGGGPAAAGAGAGAPGESGESGASRAAARTRAGLCPWYEQLEDSQETAFPEAGVYTLSDLRDLGRRQTWCPYFLARRAVAAANVLVWSYQYLLDPKASALVSRELESEAVVVFDEAHNIDNVCIEALSVEVRPRLLDAAGRSVARLRAEVARAKAHGAERLRDEYGRLLRGLASRGALGDGTTAAPADETSNWLANPAVPTDVLEEAVPGNIRRAEHFLAFLSRLLSFLRSRLAVSSVQSEGPAAFVAAAQAAVAVDARTLRFCHDRLGSLLRALEVVPGDDHAALGRVADFATLVGTYADGFAVISEPWDDRAPGIPDPVLHLACLDASLAIRPTFERFRSVVITSGTLSPIDLYPRLLGFHPVAQASLNMTLTRACVCPCVVTRGADQTQVSTRWDARQDPNVLRNYGRLLVELASVVPDGLVAFFVSYSYMDQAVSRWHETGVLQELLEHKLVFVESADVLETTLALDNYRRACDAGRGAVFLSVARGKVAEGIDFDRHYGRAVVMFGVPYQYTLSRVLRARLEFARDSHGVSESDYLAFDAIRQAAQCVGRVIRSKADYGLMVLADARYARRDKRDKLPVWISSRLRDSHASISTDMLLTVAREFLREMAQPYDVRGADGSALLSAAALDALDADFRARRSGGYHADDAVPPPLGNGRRAGRGPAAPALLEGPTLGVAVR